MKTRSSHGVPGSLLERLASLKLIVVTGKGGTGKTVISAVLGRLLADLGLTVLAMETDPRENLHHLLDIPPSGGEIAAAGGGLFLQNLKPLRVLDELVGERLKLGVLARKVLASPVYRHFAEGAPGLKETGVLGRALQLVRGRGPRTLRKPDLVILDARATGHGGSLLHAPALVADVVSSGPVGHMASEIASFVADRSATGVVTVTLAEEMPVRESLELVAGLAERLARRPEAMVVNGLYPPVTGEPDRQDDPAVALWHSRRKINESQLDRIREGWSGPLIELPLLPIDRGPELAAAVARRLGAQLEAAPAEGA